MTTLFIILSHPTHIKSSLSLRLRKQLKKNRKSHIQSNI